MRRTVDPPVDSTVNIIVGAGQTGAYAATAMRDAGFDGRILLIGDETHLPYNRPPLSKSHLAAPDAPALEPFFAADRYASAGIELLLGSPVVELDADACRIRLRDCSAHGFDNLVLATGSRARPLAIPGAESALTLRTPEDARRLCRLFAPGLRVVCIGAGVIGLEIASSARARGCQVVVIEAGPAVMARSLPPDLSAAIHDLHSAAGVEIVLGARPDRIRDGRVQCSNGEAFAADIVVAGIGIERNTQIAAAAGLDVDDGILTDAAGRTSAPGIFAAGEVAAYWDPLLGMHVRQETWRHAQQHGEFVGRSVAGARACYTEPPWFWTDQHGVNIQVAGTHVGRAATVLRRAASGRIASAFHLAPDNRVIGVVGLDAGRDVAAGMRLMRAGAAVDPGAIGDMSVPVHKLVRALASSG